LIDREKEVFTMTRKGKVLLTVLVLMLTCFLVIGAGSSEIRAQGMAGKKLIKIWVDENTGYITSIKLAGAGPNDPDQSATPVFPPFPDFQFRGNILFYKTNPSCIVISVGGYPMQVCW